MLETTAVPTSELAELLTVLALAAGMLLGTVWGVVLGYLASQPSRQERRTLRNALDAYLAAGVTQEQAEEAKRLRYGGTLRER